LIALAMSLHGQGIAPTGRIALSAEARKAAGDQVAKRIETIRASAKLPPLKRVRASAEERELVCTAAITGRTVHDPKFGTLETYVTSDLLAEPESLKLVALGSTACQAPERCPEDGNRRKVYSDKNWGRFSIVVERNPDSAPDHPLYTVGVARHSSALMEFLAPLSFDNPVKDSRDWKAQVVPECRNLTN
jgi:hypothetical protein